METLILKGNKQQAVPCVATIGMFDGVHKGHRFVLGQVCDYAKAQRLASMVITFDQHPREVVQTDWKPQLLTTFEERMRLLAETGIDYCVVLPFTQEMAALSAGDFMQLMAHRLGVRVLMIGYDNRFGHNRHDTFEDYVRYGEEIGMEVKNLPPMSPSMTVANAPRSTLHSPLSNISSSVIRRLLAEGDVREAAKCLTYPYSITGTVVKGEHIGTALGFPTANLQPDDPRKLIPAAGVYAVEVIIGGQPPLPLLAKEGNSRLSTPLLAKEGNSRLSTPLLAKEGDSRLSTPLLVKEGQGWLAMMNIGTRPTFGEHPQTLEVHILDYEGDLYGQEITVSFIERLREERRFENEEELKAQLREDRKRIEGLKD